MVARNKELEKHTAKKVKRSRNYRRRRNKVLYEKNLFGISNAEALLNTLWFMNTIHFGLRGFDEHRHNKWGDVKLLRCKWNRIFGIF